MGSPTSTTLPPPPPPRGPAKPSLHDLQYREQEIRTRLLELELQRATNPNGKGVGDYVWDSNNMRWVHS